MKYIDADKLKVEIERRRLHFNKEAEKYQALNNGYSQNCYGARDALRDLENYLDTLPEQPVVKKSNALFDKCVENCDPAVMKEVSDNVDKMLASEGLEEEMDEMWLEWCEDVDYLAYASIARHFAEWAVKQKPIIIQVENPNIQKLDPNVIIETRTNGTGEPYREPIPGVKKVF